ncbi:MAG: HVO_0758 family zinc finger protein [Halobacteriales archaeon]
MDSVQQGLRKDELRRDTFNRLQCAACGTELERNNDTDSVGTVRICPDCGTEWEEL